jgi:hypothetical protein
MPDAQKPKWWFYVLAVVAFLLWAVGTVPELGAIVNLSAGLTSLAIPVAVFGIPALDSLLTPKN